MEEKPQFKETIDRFLLNKVKLNKISGLNFCY